MAERIRASRQEQVGGAGVSEVSAAFERLGWGVVENSRHDLGTDLFVMARDELLYDLGMLVDPHFQGRAVLALLMPSRRPRDRCIRLSNARPSSRYT